MNKLITRCAAIIGLILLFATNLQAASSVTFYHHDALGSVIAMSDQDGFMSLNEEYQPYGEKVYGTEDFSSSNEDWYTGKNYSKELDLTYFGARWYDAKQGRFLSIDPVPVSFEQIHSFNRYSYTNNNPYKFVDPNGEVPIFAPIILGLLEAANLTYEAYDTAENPCGDCVRSSGVGIPVSLGGAGAKASASAFGKATKSIANPVPGTLARVVPGHVNPKTLGTTADVFVTNAKALKGLNAKQIADKLTIPQSSSGFKVIEFPTPSSGIASPVSRNNPGFVGGGRTAGGAPEFVIPNGPLPAGAATRAVR